MGYRLIRWIGDPSPWSDPAIAKALAFQRLPLPLVQRLQYFNKWQRILVVPGRTQHILAPASGFSRTYIFGPQEFRVWMDDADVDLLFHNEWDRWQFIDVTDNPSQRERPRMEMRDWQRLLESFSKLGHARVLKPEYRM